MDQQTFLRIDEHPTIAEMPACERPIDRLYVFGAAALSSTELLAIHITSPNAVHIASRLIAEYGSLYEVARSSPSQLERFQGIGHTTAARIGATSEIATRLAAHRVPDLYQIHSPADAANLLMPEMQLLEQEEMRVLILGTKNHVLATTTVYRGSLNTSLIRICELFREPIRRNAATIVVAHNHPSGDPTPSPEDVNVTKQIVAAGELLDISVLDHIIIGCNRFISLKERGLGF